MFIIHKKVRKLVSLKTISFTLLAIFINLEICLVQISKYLDTTSRIIDNFKLKIQKISFTVFKIFYTRKK